MTELLIIAVAIIVVMGFMLHRAAGVHLKMTRDLVTETEKHCETLRLLITANDKFMLYLGLWGRAIKMREEVLDAEIIGD